MQTIQQTFTGAQDWEINIPGKYFTLLECTNPCSITFYKGGKKLELGEINALLAGLEVTPGELDSLEPSFDRVKIAVSAADTVKVGIGNGQARYNRSQGNVSITNVGGGFTNSQKTVTSTSAVLLAAKPGRRYLLVQNNDPSGIIYLSFGVAATTTNAIKIAPGGSYTVDASYCPNDAIHAIGSIASNANVVAVEG